MSVLCDEIASSYYLNFVPVSRAIFGGRICCRFVVKLEGISTKISQLERTQRQKMESCLISAVWNEEFEEEKPDSLFSEDHDWWLQNSSPRDWEKSRECERVWRKKANGKYTDWCPHDMQMCCTYRIWDMSLMVMECLRFLMSFESQNRSCRRVNQIQVDQEWPIDGYTLIFHGNKSIYGYLALFLPWEPVCRKRE